MFHNQISRRNVLHASSFGICTAFGASFLSSLLAAEQQDKRKSCIFVFLEGGPSQFETFDPKPGASTAGPTEAIDTKIGGVKFAKHLPRLAAIADKLAIVRTLNCREGDHERAQLLMHTGYRPDLRLQRPALGSTVAWRRADPAIDVPAFASIGVTFPISVLGPQYGSYVIDDVNNLAPALQLPEGFSEERMKRRLRALETVNTRFDDRFQSSLGGNLSQLTRRADRMRNAPVFHQYDPAQAEPKLFERYGGAINDGNIARACLTARRLVEAGVQFVEIMYDGWDTHADNFNQVQTLSASLDAGVATLIEDLGERGLLDQCLVVCVGEFGRTPQINANNGRDHFPDVFSALLAGGGLNVGQAIGESSDDGKEIKTRPVSIADFHATLLTALGVDVSKDYFAPDGRRLRLTDNGQPMKEVIAT